MRDRRTQAGSIHERTPPPAHRQIAPQDHRQYTTSYQGTSHSADVGMGAGVIRWRVEHEKSAYPPGGHLGNARPVVHGTPASSSRASNPGRSVSTSCARSG